MPIEFLDFPSRGEVALDSADGVYLNGTEAAATGRWQIVVVGPCRWTPGDMVDALSDRLGFTVRLREIFILTPNVTGPDIPTPRTHIPYAEQIMRRGFLGIVVERER